MTVKELRALCELIDVHLYRHGVVSCLYSGKYMTWVNCKKNEHGYSTLIEYRAEGKTRRECIKNAAAKAIEIAGSRSKQC